MYEVVFLQLQDKTVKEQSFKKDEYIQFGWRESEVLEPVVCGEDAATHFCLVDQYGVLPEEINAPCEEFDPLFNTSDNVGGMVWDIKLYSKIMEIL